VAAPQLLDFFAKALDLFGCLVQHTAVLFPGRIYIFVASDLGSPSSKLRDTVSHDFTPLGQPRTSIRPIQSTAGKMVSGRAYGTATTYATEPTISGRRPAQGESKATMSREDQKARARALFKKEEKQRQDNAAKTEYQAQQEAVREKTERLRAQRLARDAAEATKPAALTKRGQNHETDEP
jgi:hypothetical protein